MRSPEDPDDIRGGCTMSQNTLAGRDCLRLVDLTPEEF